MAKSRFWKRLLGMLRGGRQEIPNLAEQIIAAQESYNLNTLDDERMRILFGNTARLIDALITEMNRREIDAAESR